MAVTILEWGQSVLLVVPSASCLFLSFSPPLVRLADDDNRVRFWSASKKEKEKRKQKAVEGDGMKCFPESSEFVNNRVATLTLVYVCYQFLGWREMRGGDRFGISPRPGPAR
jgi:hypothetical protein